MASLRTLSVLRRLRGSESCAEVIEFALTLPLLLLVVLGIIEFGFVFQQYEVVTNAAREGARVASLSTYGSTNVTREQNARARVNEYLIAGGLQSSDAIVCVGPPEATDTTDADDVCTGALGPSPLPGAGGVPTCVTTVRVKVRYNHPVAFVGGIVSYFGGSFGDLTLRARSTMRTEASAGGCP
jgi:Flp pilus assembly protein TadG